MFVPLRKAVELTGLHPHTLRKYADNGKVEATRSDGGQRLYKVDSLPGQRKQMSSVVCYCRVSSPKQKDDLARQVAYMRSKFPEAEIVKDIGSGINYKRKGLKAILERLLDGDKLTLIVAYRDRLARFGFELIEFMVEQNGGELMVLEQIEESPEQELVSDLCSIITVFSCRLHGLRKYNTKIKEDKDLPNERTEESI